MWYNKENELRSEPMDFYCDECSTEYEEEWGNLIEINGLVLCEKCAKKYLKDYFKKNKKSLKNA